MIPRKDQYANLPDNANGGISKDAGQKARLAWQKRHKSKVSESEWERRRVTKVDDQN
ncbi:hypothetical protein GORHZ_207_00120 [Gordonia rhizosphera NBRC 16068]|uniref:Uncharacterized protein n=1 Tax=Gordonia rhizosphera NBRC 16068 TaxID=1108045 RepID=K6VAC9_9ACTN|nr:hypothetical protein GORHZ_207_00120 [Gordonia rhizosphera NBRC 16068]